MQQVLSIWYTEMPGRGAYEDLLVRTRFASDLSDMVVLMSNLQQGVRQDMYSWGGEATACKLAWSIEVKWFNCSGL